MKSPPPTSPFLRSLLDAAREDTPSPDDLAEIARGLPLTGAPRTITPRPPRRLAAPVAVAAVLALAAGFALWKRAAPRPAETAALPVASADWPAAPVASAPDAPVAHAEIPPPAVPAPAPSSDAATARPGIAIRPAPRHAPSPAPSAATTEATSASAAAPPPPPPAAAATRDEGDLLDRAAIVLERNPTEALRLADQHLAAFPAGALREEREIIAVEALLQLGRVDEARARGARFLQQYPTSTRRSLMEAMLAR
jgi:hypothetical protein